jgi:predicted N-acetyltransferase YhbS
MEDVKIRAATEDDIPRIIELYGDLTITRSQVEDGRDPSSDDYRRVMARIRETPGHELLVLEYGGEVAGTLVLLIVPNLSHSACPWALLENLIVDRRHRRRGLGRMLMEYAVSRARDSGCHKVTLNSDKRRDDAHSFYRSLGFEASAHGFRLYF